MAETSEKSFPFDSEIVNGKPDRKYLAEDFARYFRTFVSSGVFIEQATNLQVIANGDMTVTLKPGSLMIDGYRYDVEHDIIIRLDPADGVLNRIDRIAGTWSREDRDIHYTVQKGEQSYEPSAAACRRTGDYRDFVFADVYIRAGAISISQVDITDQRMNSEVCGLAVPFTHIDTKMIFDQLQAFYKEVVENNTAWEGDSRERFETWFSEMKDQLSEDAAGKLNEKIDGHMEDSSIHITPAEREKWGNEDISGIGNGTVTGALSALNSSLSALGNIRYDIETDMIQIYNGSEWMDFMGGGLFDFLIFKDGKVWNQLSLHNGSASTAISGDELILSCTSSCTYLISVDLTKYKTLKSIARVDKYIAGTTAGNLVVQTGTGNGTYFRSSMLTSAASEHSIDVSDLTGRYYVGFYVAINSGTNKLFIDSLSLSNSQV